MKNLLKFRNYSEKSNLKGTELFVKEPIHGNGLKKVNKKKRISAKNTSDIRGFLHKELREHRSISQLSGVTVSSRAKPTLITHSQISVNARSQVHKSFSGEVTQLPTTYSTKTERKDIKEATSARSSQSLLDRNTLIVDMADNGISKTEAIEWQKSVTSDKEEIEKLEAKIDGLKNDSMEKLLMEIKLEMKKESVKTRCVLIQVVNSNTGLQEQITSLQTAQQEDSDQVKTVTTNVEKVRDDVKLLRDIAEKQAMMLEHLQDRNDERDQKLNRCTMFITGIEEPEESEEGENVINSVQTFFSQIMLITKKITIKSATRTGNGSPRSIKLELSSMKDKGVIYTHSKNLKGLVNNQNKGYYLNDHLPAAMQEVQRTYRDIIKRNKALPDGEQANMAIKKGRLFINNNLYKPAVTPPSVAAIISPDDLQGINKVKLVEGEPQYNGGCKFVGMSQEVSSIQDIRKGYIKARRMHPKALHVACGYRLPGHDVHSNGHVDDKEHGAGRSLYSLLESSSIKNRAVYVARYYGGTKLGPSRFTSFTDAAASAIARSSLNTLTGANQIVVQSKSNKTTKSTPRRRTTKSKENPIQPSYLALDVATVNEDVNKNNTGYASAASPRPFTALNSPFNPSWADNAETDEPRNTRGRSASLANKDSIRGRPR